MAQEIEETIHRTELPFKLDEITLGDGNCFARAVTQQCQRELVKKYLEGRGQSVRTYMELKRNVCQFMKKKTEVPMLKEFKERFEARQSEARMRGERADNWDQYWERMEKNGEWADAVFVQGTSFYLGTDLFLIPSATANEERPVIPINGNYNQWQLQPCPGPTLLLGYINNLHYQSVLPIDEEQNRLDILDPLSIDDILRDQLSTDIREGEPDIEEEEPEGSCALKSAHSSIQSTGGSCAPNSAHSSIQSTGGSCAPNCAHSSNQSTGGSCTPNVQREELDVQEEEPDVQGEASEKRRKRGMKKGEGRTSSVPPQKRRCNTEVS